MKVSEKQKLLIYYVITAAGIAAIVSFLVGWMILPFYLLFEAWYIRREYVRAECKERYGDLCE